MCGSTKWYCGPWKRSPSNATSTPAKSRATVESVTGKQQIVPPVQAAASGATESRPRLLLDEIDRAARRYQHFLLIGGLAWIGIGLACAVLMPGLLPIAIALWIGGVGMMVAAGRVRQQWEIDYLGHNVRFENGVYTSGRLMIDGKTMASGGVGFRTELSARIPRGHGAGDQIVVKTSAGFLSFRCRLFVQSKASAPPLEASPAQGIGGAGQTPRLSQPALPMVKAPLGHCSPWSRVRLLATLTVWTTVLVGGFGYSFPLIWNEWWPWAFHEYWETSVDPQSGAYGTVHLRAEQDVLLGTTLRPADPQAALGWDSNDRFARPGRAVTLEMDSFLDEWRWTPPDGTATRLQDEPQPEFVVQRMKAAGIDISKPGVQEEAAALIGLLKDAAKGVLLGTCAFPGPCTIRRHQDRTIRRQRRVEFWARPPGGNGRPRRYSSACRHSALGHLVTRDPDHRATAPSAVGGRARDGRTLSPGNDRILGRDPLLPGCGGDFDLSLGPAIRKHTDIVVHGLDVGAHVRPRCILQLVRNRQRPGVSRRPCALFSHGLLRCAVAPGSLGP